MAYSPFTKPPTTAQLHGEEAHAATPGGTMESCGGLTGARTHLRLWGERFKGVGIPLKKHLVGGDWNHGIMVNDG